MKLPRRMTDADVVAAIRQFHRRANIAFYEQLDTATVRWDLATVDPGGTIFGHGPYLKVPVDDWALDEPSVVRVYAPERLRRRIAERWRAA